MMGEVADWQIEMELDNLAYHKAGLCDDFCRYCDEEYTNEIQEEQKDEGE